MVERSCVELNLTHNDAAHIAALRGQDVAAFSDLVRGNEPLVVGLCQAMGLNGPDREDAAAEAFAEVYRSLPSYEGRSKVSTWVYRIAYRVVLRIRTERRRLRHAELNERTTADPSPSSAELVEERDNSQRIWAAVAQLEPRQAAAVELYYRRDCSVDEIAERLACPPGTIKTLLHRARATLKETLKGEVVL
jgi:RNA polymerase sigma-70 factor (ECF subfamily)